LHSDFGFRILLYKIIHKKRVESSQLLGNFTCGETAPRVLPVFGAPGRLVKRRKVRLADAGRPLLITYFGAAWRGGETPVKFDENPPRMRRRTA
jgi:hypothetical protein